eukprot:TRINITY_DN243_c0_g1_i2.p1 TRINITY_DN243_c0_g1~~TRINITY_DN243_c0_g1_i2.p1  ORF type:complete len:530 (+),score=141.34 TRINITY_DN243_c0_g1_i2:134-1723(+)
MALFPKAAVLLLCLCSAIAVRDPYSEFERQHRRKATMKRFASRLVDADAGCPLLPAPVPADQAFLAAIKPAVANLEQTMAEFFKTQKSPGVSLGLIYDQQLLWSGGFGRVNASDESSPSPDGQTLYRIGSISKVFADLLAFQLRDAGKLDLDDPVNKYVPAFNPTNPFPNEQPISFRHLGSHLAGLPRESPCAAVLSQCNLTNDQMFRNIESTVLILPPNLQSVYSNMGFAVLGHALEILMGTPYDELVMTNITQPLGMWNTGFEYNQSVFDRMAWGFDPSYTDLGWEGPAGQMYSSVEDMAKLASFLFTADMRPDWDPPFDAEGSAPLLGQTSLRQMFAPQYVDPDGAFAFGLPWEMYQTPSGWLITKGGEVDQYSTEIGLLPAVKLGVVALCTAPDDVCGPFLSEMFNTFLPPLVNVLRQLTPPPALPAYVSTLVGNYSCPLWPGLANVTIVPAGAGQQLLVQGDHLTATAAQYIAGIDRFVIALPANYTCTWATDGVSGQYIEFTRSPNVTMRVPGLMPPFTWVKI